MEAMTNAKSEKLQEEKDLKVKELMEKANKLSFKDIMALTLMAECLVEKTEV